MVAAVAGSWLAPYPYDEMNIMSRLQPPGGPISGSAPTSSAATWFSRTLVGTGSSLVMGRRRHGAEPAGRRAAGGWSAGYKGGRVGEAIMRAMDVLMSFPPILLGILVLAVTPPASGRPSPPSASSMCRRWSA